MPKDYSVKERSMPMVALRGLWIYPHMVMHFDVGRDKSLKAIDEALDTDSRLFVVSQRDFSLEEPEIEDLYKMGVIVEIKQTLKLPNGSLRILVEGINRARLVAMEEDQGFVQASIEEYIYQDSEIDDKMRAARRLVMQDLKEYENYNSLAKPEIIIGIDDIDDPGRFADTAASYIQLSMDDEMEILEELDLYKRLVKLHKLLVDEIGLEKIQAQIDKKVKEEIDKSQREYYLREQLGVIKKELGEDSAIARSEAGYKKVLEEKDLPDYVEEAAQKEIERLSSLNPNSPEVNVSMTYLDYLLDIPWGEYDDEEIDLKKTKRILDEDHYDMKEVKDRILEYVAVMKKTGKVSSQILCFVGPPGVGKTSISRSIARSLDREFVSMRLGGMRDEAEIRGHRKTYVGAMPGKIVKLITKAGIMNPVFLLDEIDKLTRDFAGDPASALLEVLDPEQNDEFTDHFLEVPLDLSRVIFITTANSLETIPSALIDRMEIIRLEGYSYEEKYNIARNHLLPSVIKDHGLEDSEVSISPAALKKIINNYSKEAGVRELERMLSRAIRRGVRKMIEEDQEEIKITVRNLKDYLGEEIYLDEDVSKKAQLGVVTGLAWTQLGGVVLEIEANTMPGSGKLILTGSLGDVMKESAQTGLAYIRSHYKDLGLEEDFFKERDIHPHIPEGAIPKDGPSAGITMTTAMVSAFTGKKARRDLAMTGEMTLTGRVLAVGGIKEKLLAARRNGINKIILSKQNKRDINKLKDTSISQMDINYVDRIEEVLDVVFDED